MTEIETAPDTEFEVDSQPKLLPPYHVIIENDDHHSMDFVIAVLLKVFSYDMSKCIQLMMTAHEQGRAVVWTGSKEVAELKLEQIQTFKEGLLGTLSAYIEASC